MATLAPVLVVVALCAFAPATVAGQEAEQATQQTEAQLLRLIANQPASIVAHLDLAKLYVEQGRLEEAYELLARGLALVSEARQGQADPTGPQEPVRIGGDIEAPKKLKDVRPAYPQEAQDAGVQGMVIIEAIIDRQGAVREAQVIRSVPMLDDAAVDSVLEWEYTPTILGGQPVEVIMTVTVNFTLRR